MRVTCKSAEGDVDADVVRLHEGKKRPQFFLGRLAVGSALDLPLYAGAADAEWVALSEQVETPVLAGAIHRTW